MKRVYELAEEVGMDRSAMLKRCRKLGYKIEKLPAYTEAGLSEICFISDHDAETIRAYYRGAVERSPNVARIAGQRKI